MKNDIEQYIRWSNVNKSYTTFMFIQLYYTSTTINIVKITPCVIVLYQVVHFYKQSVRLILSKRGHKPQMGILNHDDVIKWKLFPRYWPFVRGIHRSPVISPHKGQWRGALMFSSIYAWINDWVNTGEAGDFRRYRAHYDVTVVICIIKLPFIIRLW